MIASGRLMGTAEGWSDCQTCEWIAEAIPFASQWRESIPASVFERNAPSELVARYALSSTT